MTRRLTQLALVVIAVACASGPIVPAPAEGPEARSFRGAPLMARTDSTGAIARADSVLVVDPTIDHFIAAGQARAAVWRYRDAIAIYSRAMRIDPMDPRLYRHRGHRYMSIRRFDHAAADLDHASRLDSLNFDIEYHRGLAYFLRGDFATAANVYARCLARANNDALVALERSGALGTDYRSCMQIATDDDSRVALSEWLYRALRRAGREAEASTILATIRPGMNVVDNVAYYRTLLLYKGELSEEEVLASVGRAGTRLETMGYGIANWHLVRGDTVRALALLEEIVTDPWWPGFGYIAAEVELKRLGRR
jgi:tetratricopeptide (TPR) repeat protein